MLRRRIGRLPSDKAVEVARQICAGLAAVHEHGVIHRDLKPTNIMIDGRGQVRITDFGLAGVAGTFALEESLDGTPAYMAPEQFAGKDASIQSDLYALGLVLYEVFTGKCAFEAATVSDLRRAHQHSSPTNPSLLVRDIDPIVERVILRCLEKDPAKRPTRALQVMAALPGGDPLAAALAAGETPSPEMVAASGESEGLRPVVAWALLAGVAVTVTAAILLSAQTTLYRRVPLDQPPEALAERARDILRNAGYSEPPTDTAMGFYEGEEFLRYVAQHDRSKTRWDDLETGAFVFWYRGSPRPLQPQYFHRNAPMLGFVWTDDPPLDVSGMTLVRLNPLGRLTQFIAVPPQVEQPAGAAPVPDWAPLFSAAGLHPSKWAPAQPTWAPPVYGDWRAAWTGTLAERPAIPMRIEAAAYRGKPVYFELIGPWTRPERMQLHQATAGERAFLVIIIILLLSMLVIGVMLGRRNLRLGRGDRRAASRLAAYVFAAEVVAVSFGAHYVPNLDELSLFFEFLVWGLGFSALSWVLYITLEPYVRRRWPATLVSWSRLLARGFWDPLVGRDVLVGCHRNKSKLCAFFHVCVFVCSVPFQGLAAQRVGGCSRIRLFLHGLPQCCPSSGLPICVRRMGSPDSGADLKQLDYVAVDPPRFSGWRGFSLRHVLSPVPSTDDPRVCVVCGNQSGRDPAAGRDGVLWLLHLPGGTTGFRRSGARGVSGCCSYARAPFSPSTTWSGESSRSSQIEDRHLRKLTWGRSIIPQHQN
jgi:hypothetical protein